MRILSFLLLICLVSPLAWAGPGKGKNKGKGDKNKDQYYKYEREDVSAYRDRRSFTMPTPPEQAPPPPQEVEIETLSLEPLFYNGNKVYVETDNRLDQLVRRDSVLKSKVDKLPGYRIQIYADVSRQGALRTKSTLMKYFPGAADHTYYRAPNYVVRVGDFLEKEDAIQFARKLKEVFPNAFIAPDQVNLPREYKLETPKEEDRP